MATVRVLDSTFLAKRIRPTGWEGEIPEGPELDSAIQHGLVEVVAVESAAEVVSVPEITAQKAKRKF